MIHPRISNACLVFAMTLAASLSSPSYAASLAISDTPLFTTITEPPLTMLVMGKDHKLYYEAYNDASNLNDDPAVDVGYQGYHSGSNVNLNVDYYGYFNSYVCYTYNSSNGRFEPSSGKNETQIAARDKTCSGANEWSGDFLNYVTTARIDALRKVFYGGSRSTDTSSETVLERTHIPQDAHAWGKEYKSIARDGYDIANYTPLSEPATDTYHLFANVSLANETSPYGSMSASATPRLRVMNDSKHRVWEWLSIERPVAGRDCINGLNGPRVRCETTGSGSWSIVPSSFFSNLTRTTYDISGTSYHPTTEAEFDVMEATYISRPFGSDTFMDNINHSGNPHGSNDQYMTIIEGNLIIPTTGSYTFAVDGDDAVEFSIWNGSDWDVIAAWYGGHGRNNSDIALLNNSGTVTLSAGTYAIRYRHEERGGGDSYHLYYNQPTVSSSIDDYVVRVEVCNGIDSVVPNRANSCQLYPNGNYKPVGLLHEFGEDERMMFGLLSGSYENNLDGGVLRKAVSSFTDEVNANDGTYTSINGIVSAIDALRTVNFDDSGYRYNCGWITNRPIRGGECDMWGNPVAEMMYETLRYFSGKSGPTSDFDIATYGNNDSSLGLPKASWSDPYDVSTGFNECATPFQVVVTDINPSYDSDKVPGSAFSSFSGDISGLNVSTLADTITSGEGNIANQSFFIGESGSVSDTAPTEKIVSSLSNIRGMAPEEPTKLGSYYASSLAYYGLINDINPRAGEQNLQTFSVALASPLPTIEIDIDQNETTDNSIVIVPFAKSAYSNRATTSFFATNQIVDFYVESLDATSGSFLVNFEDVEQGADHDMDAIARYSYSINSVDQTVTINVDSVYAAGGIDQRMGYVISGSDHDGVYLEVRDQGGGSYVFHLDTPSSIWAGEPRGNDLVGLNASRTFSASGAGSAGFLKDPLWYAAKWGGFIEADNLSNLVPDVQSEWDSDGDGDPDNYFRVTNALTLKEQMESAFDEVLSRVGAGSSLAANSGSLDENSVLYQATFRSGDWYGELRAIDFADGVVGNQIWNASDELETQLDPNLGFDANREMITIKDNGVGIPFRFPSDYTSPNASEMSTAQVTALLQGVSTDVQGYGTDLVNYLRGDKSNENRLRNFRKRAKPYGDIVHSDPLFVDAPGFFYKDTWPNLINNRAAIAPENASGVQTYTEYVALMKDRLPVLYFGANDGALHAINAYINEGTLTGQGREILSYVPGEVYENLIHLADPRYSHKYYVDGKTTFGDVFFSQSTSAANNKWHSVLVGGLRGGGQGIYALDISDPHGIAGAEGYASFDENNAEELVLWEFSDTDDADLGFTFGRPKVARMANGRWAAVFGNGYDNTEPDTSVSATGNAAIYVVDIETGALIKKFDTGVGSLDDPLGLGRPNGMSEPTTIDLDGDDIVDYIYAGDLFGNIWKLDVSDVNANNWKFSNYSGGDPASVFVATTSDGLTRLPVTTRVLIASHPVYGYRGDSLMLFATGKYFENSDTEVVGQPTQSIFGIWDDGLYGFDRSDLAVQKIEERPFDGGAPGEERRYLSDNEVRWSDRTSETGSVLATKHGGWVLDLVDTNGFTLDNEGERVISNMIMSEGRLLTLTFIPSDDPCKAGGSGWLMAINAATGGSIEGPVLDVNNDDVINDGDLDDTDGDGKADTSPSAVLISASIGGLNQTGRSISFNDSTGEASEIGIKVDRFLNKRLNWRELR